MSEEPKKIEVIEGDGSELEISLVHDHINNIQQPRRKHTEEIIIPKVKKKEDKKEEIENDEDEDIEIEEIEDDEN